MWWWGGEPPAPPASCGWVPDGRRRRSERIAGTFPPSVILPAVQVAGAATAVQLVLDPEPAGRPLEYLDDVVGVPGLGEDDVAGPYLVLLTLGADEHPPLADQPVLVGIVEVLLYYVRVLAGVETEAAPAAPAAPEAPAADASAKQ